jgi:hypothetical protein
MNPKLAVSGRSPSRRPTSEKRAAAARANGAKSRGPVTATGRANSARNSRSHGLRSHTLFTDPESLADLASQLAIFESDFSPQSSIERNLVKMMAVAYWRLTSLRNLEAAVFNREVQRLKSQMREEKTPEEDPIMLHERAFRSLSDHTCFLHTFFRLEGRFERQYLSALRTWNAGRAECAVDRIPEKVNLNERTQQVTENTAAAHSGQAQPTAACRSGNPNPKNVIIDERTQQAVENTGPPSEPILEIAKFRAAGSARS